jgi:hypothetical protein
MNALYPAAYLPAIRPGEVCCRWTPNREWVAPCLPDRRPNLLVSCRTA